MTSGQRGTPLGSPEEAASTGRAVREMFAAVAPRYDFLNHFLSLGLDIVWRRETAKCLSQILEPPSSVAVDVCCGTGDLTAAFERYSRGKVVAADFCRPMLVRARAKLERKALPALLLEADALSLPFRSGSLDLIGSAFGFRNLANYALGLEEMHRVLKADGTVAILEFSHVRWPIFGPLFRFYFHHILPRLGSLISGVRAAYQYLPDSVSQFPDQEALATAMRRAGFVNVRYRIFWGGVAALHLGQKFGA